MRASVILTVLTLICPSLISCQSSERKTVHIGALLNNRLQKEAIEAAVRYFQNDDDSYLRRFEIVPDVTYIQDKSSFQVGKEVCGMLSKSGEAAIFGPHSRSLEAIVKSTTQTLGIPNIFANLETNSSRKTLYQLNLHPHYDDLAKALYDLMTAFTWKAFAIVYETDEGLARLQEVLRLWDASTLKPITLIKLSGSDYRPAFKTLFKAKVTRIVLDCEKENILKILGDAESIGMMNDYVDYILTSLDAHTIPFSEYFQKQNLTFFRMVDPSSEEVQKGLKVWPNIESDKIPVEAALMYDAVHAFVRGFDSLDERFETVTVNPLSCEDDQMWGSGPHLYDYIKHVKFDGMSGPVKFDENGRRIKFTLDIMQSTGGETNKIGTWDEENKVFISPVTLMENANCSITRNKTLKVAAKLVDPHIMLRESCKDVPYSEIQTDCLKGYALDLVEKIVNEANFKNFTFYLVADKEHGKLNEKTKEWNGIIKDVMDRKADLGICDMTMNVERAGAVDFTTPFMNLGIQILFKKPAKEETKWYSFMRPFNEEVWLFTATGFLAVTVTLFLTSRLSPEQWVNTNPLDKEPEELENDLNFINCLWFSIGSLLCQGCDILPRGKGPRMLSAFFGFFCLLIMNASYTANLAAFLTSSRMPSAINNAEDLSKQTKVKFGCMANGATAKFFEKSDNPTYKKLGIMMKQFGDTAFLKDNKLGVKKVLSENRKFAFFMESVSIDYEKENDKNCELESLGGLLDSKGYAIAMPTGSPYRTCINHALLQLSERGELKNLTNKWWKREGGCSSQPREPDSLELGMANVGGVFMVLFAGCIAAFFISIFELLWNCRKIAVEEKVTPWEAISSEIKFVFQFSKQKKPVRLTRSRFL